MKKIEFKIGDTRVLINIWKDGYHVACNSHNYRASTDDNFTAVFNAVVVDTLDNRTAIAPF